MSRIGMRTFSRDGVVWCYGSAWGVMTTTTYSREVVGLCVPHEFVDNEHSADGVFGDLGLLRTHISRIGC